MLRNYRQCVGHSSTRWTWVLDYAFNVWCSLQYERMYLQLEKVQNVKTMQNNQMLILLQAFFPPALFWYMKHLGRIQILPLPLWLLPTAPVVGAFGAVVVSELIFLRSCSDLRLAVPPSGGWSASRCGAEEKLISSCGCAVKFTFKCKYFVFAWLFKVSTLMTCDYWWLHQVVVTSDLEDTILF